MEAAAASGRCLAVLDDRATVVLNSKPTSKVFTFDYAVPENATQDEIFTTIGRPITLAVLEGYNSTVLAYGQTGSGKSHTMFGPDSIMDAGGVGTHHQRGMVPRSLDFLFDQISREVRRSNGAVQYTCRCSFFEIFNERVFDLLDSAGGDSNSSSSARASRDSEGGGSSRTSRGSDRSSGSSMMLPVEDFSGLQVREDQHRGVYVDGLSESVVACAADAGVALGKGYRNRRVAETAMNRESSRSHAVFQLLVESVEKTADASGVRKTKQSRFSLVDLAGSERQKSTSTAGDRLKEANAINKSLSALGQVINALVDRGLGKMRHVPYRDSKLTFLLRDSLGGNSRTFLVATVSPCDEQFGESLSTLKFSQRAKMITNTAVVNEEAVGSLETLQKEVSRLKLELGKAKAQAQAMKATGGLASAGSAASTSAAGSAAAGSSAEAPAPSPVEVPDPAMEKLLRASLVKYVALAKTQKRAAQRSAHLKQHNEACQQAVLAANMVIKSLRARQKGAAAAAAAPSSDEASNGVAAAKEDGEDAAENKEPNNAVEFAGLAPADAAALSAVEANLVKLPQVVHWQLACDSMRQELNELTHQSAASGDVDDSTLHSLVAENGDLELRKAALSAYADHTASLRGRNQALLGGGWTTADEAAFASELGEKYAQALAQRDDLQAQIDRYHSSNSGGAGGNNSQGEVGNGRPSSPDSIGEDDDLQAMFGAQFGDGSGKASIDLLGGDGLQLLGGSPPPPGPPSRSGSGRISIGGAGSSGGGMSRRSSVGRLSVGGGSSVAQWGTVNEANRKLREADAKLDALTKQLEAKARDLAEADKQNAVLKREIAEAAATVCGHDAVRAATDAAEVQEEATGPAAETAALACLKSAATAASTVDESAVARAVAEATAALEAECSELRREMEAAQVARFEQAQAAEQSEARFAALANAEIETANAAKAEAEEAKLQVVAEAALASQAEAAARAAEAKYASAQEAEEAATARSKELEDELETINEQVEYMTANAASASAEMAQLKQQAQAAQAEAESARKALEETKEAASALQAQLAASAQDSDGAQQVLQQQLQQQTAKLQSLQEELTSGEQARSALSTALANTEKDAQALRESLAASEAAERSATGVAADLRAEVLRLRDSVSATESTVNELEAERDTLRDDRDELAATLEEAESAAEQLREELDSEKAAYLEELQRQSEAQQELEEALEAEQQNLMDEAAAHRAALAEKETSWVGVQAALQAQVAASEARAEQAEAEAKMLSKDTQRDVAESERELAAVQHALKREETSRRAAQNELAVSAAKLEEQSRTAAELVLQVQSLEGERSNLLERTVSRDVLLQAAQREAEHLREQLPGLQQQLDELTNAAAETEAAKLDAEERAQLAVASQELAVAEAGRSKAMENEAYERQREAESLAAGLEAALDEATGRVEALAETNAQLVGHTNAKQKIHQHQKLKDELSELQKHNAEMHQKIHRLEVSEAKALAAVAAAGGAANRGGALSPLSATEVVARARTSFEEAKRNSLEGAKRISAEGAKRTSFEGEKRTSLEPVKRISLEGGSGAVDQAPPVPPPPKVLAAAPPVPPPPASLVTTENEMENQAPLPEHVEN